MSSPDLHVARFQRQLEGIAEEMGATLVRAASSPNIKEREDCSCAVFDADATLLAQAAHIPVHLGSMEHSVRAVLDQGPPVPGERWLLNDPYAGGTHLPDLTLVTAVATRGGELLGFAAARAHHADVGGRVPGSMSAHSRSIDEEGVRLAPTRIGQGIIDLALAGAALDGMRQPAERIADLSAQGAALVVAERRLVAMAERVGIDVMHERSRHLLDYGERRLAAVLGRWEGHAGSAERTLELPDGTAASVRVRVGITDGRIHVDLRGSAAQSATSLNCPRAVSDAATQLAIRIALDPTLPTSGGMTRRIDLVTTPGTVVHAAAPAAVAAGNVEVSSVLLDALLAAFGEFVDVAADGQATMNNLVLANDDFAYYETIGGGQGAGRDTPGVGAVHGGMTNTRNTPVEVLELEYPLRVERYGIRRGSGGAGEQPGGDGVVRAVRTLEACTVSLVAQRRTAGPTGRAGGMPGAVGAQSINGADVDGFVTRQLEPGDVVELRTPGGGGFGAPS